MSWLDVAWWIYVGSCCIIANGGKEMIELLIIGDSLSSPYGDYKHWPQYFEPEVAVVRNLSQAGLTMRAFELPNYIEPQPDTRRAIAVIYIGTNDAGQGWNPISYKYKLGHMSWDLSMRGYEVFIVSLPYLNIHQEQLNAYRLAQAEVAEDGYGTLIDPGWGNDYTSDGVHPSAANHLSLYYWFKEELGL